MSYVKQPQAEGGGFFSLFNLPPTVFRNEVLDKLGAAMATISGLGATSGIPSGYVYLGQFVAHDVSKLAPPTSKYCQHWELEQLRTPALDLDTVYGNGFKESPAAVKHSSGEMQLCRVIDAEGRRSTFDDLPRDLDKVAIIGDDRNDENLLIAQLHVQFLKLHNYFVKQILAGNSKLAGEKAFDEAKRMVILSYQEVVIYDLLHTVLDPIVWNYYFDEQAAGRQFIWNPIRGEEARVPIEAAAAALRFGHSMVLERYNVTENKNLALDELFAMTGSGGLNGWQGLPASHVVDWNLFFQFTPDTRPAKINLSSRIDPFVGVKLPGNSMLASKNLRTGNRLLLPDAQTLVRFIRNRYPDIASEIGLPLLGKRELNVEGDLPGQPRPGKHNLLEQLANYGLDEKTPLWYYLMAEALWRHEGQRLGPLGSLIVAETIRSLLRLSSPSLVDGGIDTDWVKKTGDVAGRKHYRMTDLLEAIRK